MNDSEGRKTPIDHALDLLVFAPLGFVFEARSLLPRFIARGRSELEVARVIGKYALRREGAELIAELDHTNRHAHNKLRVLGLLPAGDETAPSGNGTRRTAVPSGSDRAVCAPHDQHEASEVSAPSPSRRSRVVPDVPAPEVTTLAIPDYESLSASQVVPRLESLSPDELEAIRVYESHHRHRATILNKIAQLQSN